MKSLTEIIARIEAGYLDDRDLRECLLVLASHVKNLENKTKGMEAQINNGIVNTIAPDWVI